MKTIKDLENLLNQSCPPFENAYVYFFNLLENYYISKVNGINRIKDEIKDYDDEARRYIIFSLIDILSSLEYFDKNDLLQLIS